MLLVLWIHLSPKSFFFLRATAQHAAARLRCLSAAGVMVLGFPFPILPSVWAALFICFKSLTGSVFGVNDLFQGLGLSRLRSC